MVIRYAAAASTAACLVLSLGLQFWSLAWPAISVPRFACNFGAWLRLRVWFPARPAILVLGFACAFWFSRQACDVGSWQSLRFGPCACGRVACHPNLQGLVGTLRCLACNLGSWRGLRFGLPRLPCNFGSWLGFQFWFPRLPCNFGSWLGLPCDFGSPLGP